MVFRLVFRGLGLGYPPLCSLVSWRLRLDIPALTFRAYVLGSIWYSFVYPFGNGLVPFPFPGVFSFPLPHLISSLRFWRRIQWRRF